MGGFISELSSLFHLSPDLSLIQYQTILITIALWWVLKSALVSPPALFFFFKIVLALWGPFEIPCVSISLGVKLWVMEQVYVYLDKTLPNSSQKWLVPFCTPTTKVSKFSSSKYLPTFVDIEFLKLYYFGGCVFISHVALTLFPWWPTMLSIFLCVYCLSASF